MRRLLAFAAAAVMALTAIPNVAFAADEAPDTITVDYEDVKVTVSGDEKVPEVEETIERDGVTYHLDWEASEFVINDPDKKTVEGDGIEIYEGAEQTKPDAPETKVVDGVTYVFKEYKEKTEVKTGRTAHVSMTYQRNETLEADPAENMDIPQYTDPDTGLVVEVEENTLYIPYVSSELKSESWGAGQYTAQMTIHGYEFTSFDFEGVEIPKNEAVPMGPEYYPLVLRSLGNDPARFRITSIVWSGDAYQAGENLDRNALVTADVYNVMYDDFYEGDVEIPDISYTLYTPVYEEQDDDYAARLTATVKAVYVREGAETTEAEEGNQGEENGRTVNRSFMDWLKGVFDTTTGKVVSIALLLLVIGLVLFVIFRGTRRKKKKEEEN